MSPCLLINCLTSNLDYVFIITSGHIYIYDLINNKWLEERLWLNEYAAACVEHQAFIYIFGLWSFKVYKYNINGDYSNVVDVMIQVYSEWDINQTQK